MALYAIGDIQGCATAFEALLDALAFDPRSDRLWLPGDLVNRGPESLAVLRRVIGLGDAAVCVLGNHDLHLLATVAGVRAPRPQDTLDDVLRAPDRDAIVDWLRRRPLLYEDRAARRVLVHAGIPPGWTIAAAQAAAAEVENALRSDTWMRSLASMYGNSPRRWDAGLDAADRMRYTINALTRMRYCDRHGALDFDETGPPGSQSRGLVPWFDHPSRAYLGTHIVFGHWATLGVLRRDDITATDSGCVWGGQLTAIPLDSGGEPIAVSCSGYAKP
jgi:bis(5'-nucleosyl)-tetraphosphatase (symmetrical)